MYGASSAEKSQLISIEATTPLGKLEPYEGDIILVLLDAGSPKELPRLAFRRANTTELTDREQPDPDERQRLSDRGPNSLEDKLM